MEEAIKTLQSKQLCKITPVLHTAHFHPSTSTPQHPIT